MYLYVGTYTGGDLGKGIYVYNFEPENGTATWIQTMEAAGNPTFLAIDPTNRFVYSANETEPGIVSAFEREVSDGKLIELNRESSHGNGPCYVSTDTSGRYVMVANYGDGVLAVYPLGEDGHLQPSSDVIRPTETTSVSDRQNGPHAHMVAPTRDGRHILATDLGLDTITVYELDTSLGRLNVSPSPNAVGRPAPGSGPRHFACSPDGATIYVVDELANTLDLWDFADGGLTLRQTVSTLPEGFTGTNYTAQVLVSPDGRNVYVSNRGADTIAIFAIADDGTASLIGQQPTGGAWPRNFNLDPTGRWLIVANQNSGTLVTFERDPASGSLSQVGEPIEVPAPVAVLFAEV